MRHIVVALCGLASLLAISSIEAQTAVRGRILDQRPSPQMIETPEQTAAREREELQRREQELAAREQALQQEATRLAQEEAARKAEEERLAQERAVRERDRLATEAAQAEALDNSDERLPILQVTPAEPSGDESLWDLVRSFKTIILIALIAIALAAFIWRDERRDKRA